MPMQTETQPVAGVRLDLWLWAARFYRTRALAKHAIETGKVRNPRMFQKLEERIMQLEAAIEGLRAAMLDPANYASAAKMKALQADEAKHKQELADAYAQWENWS